MLKRKHISQHLKILKYERILDIEKTSFIPLVFPCIGGTGPSAARTIKQLVTKIYERKYDTYSDAITSFERNKFCTPTQRNYLTQRLR